jgi:hypothetical protein
MNDEQGNEYQLPDFDRISTIAKEMFTAALNDYPPIIAVATVEQMRSSIRDHLAGVECDPRDVNQLKAFALGAVFTIYRQGQYTPIGCETSIVPAIAIDMLDAPALEAEIVSYEHIREMFGEDEEVKSPVQQHNVIEPRLIRGLRWYLDFWDSRKKSNGNIPSK